MTAQPEETNPTRLSPVRIPLKWIASLASAGAILWPILDQLYRHEFSSPGAWWVLVLVGLAAWISFVVVAGQDRLADGQNQILARLCNLEAKEEALEHSIAVYGDERESDGHVAALRVSQNGHGPVRHLSPVD